MADTKGDRLVAALIAALDQREVPLVVIWDDFHLLGNASLTRTLNLFLKRLPPQVHVYIASREMPPLSLAKLGIQGEAALLDAEAIRFTKNETSEFLQLYGLWQPGCTDLDPALLYEQTEGWAVGIRLAALTLSDTGSPSAGPRKDSSARGPISEFLFEEVFAHLPDRQQQFLLQTSCLRRMNAGLCRAVTGMAESANMLQELERANLFLVALDDKRRWFRYHHAFRQFLMDRMQASDPDRIAGMHLAAGKWLENNGDEREAVNHYLAGGRFAESLALIERLAPDLMQGEWTTLRHWLEQVPLEWMFGVPELFFIYIGALYMEGMVDQSTAVYWWADERLQRLGLDEDNALRQKWQAGLDMLVAMRAYIERDFATFLAYSRRYLALRPAGDFLVGFGIGPDGRHLMWETLTTAEGLRIAQEVLPEMWALWAETENVYLIAHLSIDYGKWHYERNELQKAEAYFLRALDIGEEKGNAYLAVEAAIGMARIALAGGRPNRAEALLSAVRRRFAGDCFPLMDSRLRWFEAVRALARGDWEAAAAWQRDCCLNAEDELIPAMLEEHDTAACALAAMGRTEEAGVLLDRLLAMALRLKRRSDVIRLRMHRSLLMELTGETAQSLRELEEALSWAEPDGCIRTFVDEGTALRPLLERYA